MPTIEQLSQYLQSAAGEESLSQLYGRRPQGLAAQKARYAALLKRFVSDYPSHPEAEFFSSPGRTEVGGNHTDHNAGRVLAAAVDLDVIAAVAPNPDGVIRIHSEGYSPDSINVNELAIVESEKNTSRSLIRGVCARLQQLGFAIGGFDAVVTSSVPRGSGLSSSAAYEVLVAAILNHFYNEDKISLAQLAQIGQFAENKYFGKPSGLMDQTTSAVGGFVTIDFKDFANPIIRKVNYDFATSGYTLVIVDTWGDHANLTDEYAEIAREMKAVSQALGATVLRDLSEDQILQNITYLRTRVSDRAILRALHFYRDDRRVVDEVAALEGNDFPRFLRLVNESGRSSWMLLQNSYPARSVQQQGISITQAVTEAFLGRRGAWRVHGGGFAGTIQVFVPEEMLATYVRQMETICGAGACHQVMVRNVGVTHFGA